MSDKSRTLVQSDRSVNTALQRVQVVFRSLTPQKRILAVDSNTSVLVVIISALHATPLL